MHRIATAISIALVGVLTAPDVMAHALRNDPPTDSTRPSPPNWGLTVPEADWSLTDDQRSRLERELNRLLDEVRTREGGAATDGFDRTWAVTRAVLTTSSFVRAVYRLSAALEVPYQHEPEASLSRVCDGERWSGDDETLDYYIAICEARGVWQLLDEAQAGGFPEAADATERWRNNQDVNAPARQTERIVRAALFRAIRNGAEVPEVDRWWWRWRTLRAFAARRDTVIGRLVTMGMDEHLSLAVRRLVIDRQVKPEVAQRLLRSWLVTRPDTEDIDGVVATMRRDNLITRLRMSDPEIGEADRENAKHATEQLNSLFEATRALLDKHRVADAEPAKPWSPPEHPSPDELTARVHESLPELDPLRPLTLESMRAWQSSGYRRLQSSINIDGARVMLALEVYRGVHGRLPVELSALTPDVMPALPADPYSGRPFGYRLTEPGAPGPGYVLWSIGLNQRDDDGTVPTSGYNDNAVWNQPGVNGDYVLTHLP